MVDLEPLKKRLRSDAPLLREERDLAADIIARNVEAARRIDPPIILKSFVIAPTIWRSAFGRCTSKGVSYEVQYHQSEN